MCHRSELHLLFAFEIFGGDFPSELLLDPDELLLDPEELLEELDPEESGSKDSSLKQILVLCFE